MEIHHDDRYYRPRKQSSANPIRTAQRLELVPVATNSLVKMDLDHARRAKALLVTFLCVDLILSLSSSTKPISNLIMPANFVMFNSRIPLRKRYLMHHPHSTLMSQRAINYLEQKP